MSPCLFCYHRLLLLGGVVTVVCGELGFPDGGEGVAILPTHAGDLWPRIIIIIAEIQIKTPDGNNDEISVTIDVITPEDYHRLEETTIMSMLSTVSFLQCQIYFMFVKNIFDFSAKPPSNGDFTKPDSDSFIPDSAHSGCSCSVWDHNIAGLTLTTAHYT